MYTDYKEEENRENEKTVLQRSSRESEQKINKEKSKKRIRKKLVESNENS